MAELQPTRRISVGPSAKNVISSFRLSASEDTMTALFLGLLAALCWSCHDLLARRFAAALGPYRMAYWVMLAGAALLFLPVLLRGVIWTAPQYSIFIALLTGVVYAVAAAGLFYALTVAPVSIVGPIIGGYPALVVIWGMLNGLHPTPMQCLCIGVILTGVIVVARSEHKGESRSQTQSGKLPVVLVATAISALGYAATAVMGQLAAVNLGGWETTFLSRFPAAAVLLLVMQFQTRSVKPVTAQASLGILGMAIFDVIAVTAINLSTYLPNKELGAMGISASSATSVLMAMVVLKEKISAFQWLGVVMIVAGVAGLGVPL